MSFSGLSNFFLGTPETRENVSNLLPEQQQLFQQLMKALSQQGAGGAFGTSADYYRNLLSDDSSSFDAFANPMLRQYREQVVPDLAEQFAGMGAGGLSSSGFQNAALQSGVDLTERLAQMRANLRQNAAQNLQGLAGMGLQPYSQMMTTQPGTTGFLPTVASAAGTALGAYLGGPAGAAAGNGIGNFLGNSFRGSSQNAVASQTSPYQSSFVPASPTSGSGSGLNLPNFLENTPYYRG